MLMRSLSFENRLSVFLESGIAKYRSSSFLRDSDDSFLERHLPLWNAPMLRVFVRRLDSVCFGCKTLLLRDRTGGC